MPFEAAYDNEASISRSVDVSAFTSGWAAGLMMAQIEYCQKLIYRKPKTRVIETSNARTRRPHHCPGCERA